MVFSQSSPVEVSHFSTSKIQHENSCKIKNMNSVRPPGFKWVSTQLNSSAYSQPQKVEEFFCPDTQECIFSFNVPETLEIQIILRCLFTLFYEVCFMSLTEVWENLNVVRHSLKLLARLRRIWCLAAYQWGWFRSLGSQWEILLFGWRGFGSGLCIISNLHRSS